MYLIFPQTLILFSSLSHFTKSLCNCCFAHQIHHIVQLHAICDLMSLIFILWFVSIFGVLADVCFIFTVYLYISISLKFHVVEIVKNGLLKALLIFTSYGFNLWHM